MESEATIPVCITWRLHWRLQDELMRNTQHQAHQVHRSSGETTLDGRVDMFDTQITCHVHTILFVTIPGILTPLRLIFVHAIIPHVSRASYMCIGASDRIFDHFLSRSSAPTMLDNRVPMGSPFLLMRTQALSSNLIKLPSFLSPSFLARTTTACRISPRRTLLAMPTLDPPGVSGPKDLCF
jgi:hypothetical protein